METLSHDEIVEATLEHLGGKVGFRLFKNEVCFQIAEGIFAGRTYPLVPFVGDVQTIVDVGANVGAASVFFAMSYPGARVYALEPASLPLSILKQNVEPFANVRVFPCGLFSSDKTLPLYLGRNDSVESSVFPTSRTGGDCETIQLLAAREFLSQQGIARVDILKIDTEGCEVPILRSLGSYLPAVKLLYVEYHSDRDRRLIDGIVAETHALWRGRAELVHRGELCYLRRDLVPAESETHTAEILLPLQ